MIGPFAEAVRATTQPCTFLLVAPALVGVLAARARWSALVATLGAALVGGWLVAANRFVLDGGLLRWSAVLVVVVLCAAAVGSRTAATRWLGSPAAGAAVAGGTTLLATMWWRPCVGDELGAILTAAQDGGGALAGQLLPIAAYMVGAMVPVALVVAGVRLVEPSSATIDVVVRVAAVVGIVVAGALVLGRHDDVVVTLTRWTTG